MDENLIRDISYASADAEVLLRSPTSPLPKRSWSQSMTYVQFVWMFVMCVCMVRTCRYLVHTLVFAFLTNFVLVSHSYISIGDLKFDTKTPSALRTAMKTPGTQRRTGYVLFHAF